jgi:hypothetical protein
METSQLLRHQMVNGLLEQHTEKCERVVNIFWEPLATQVISIVGEVGFNSLYARTLFLNQPTCPWLALRPPPPKTSNRFADLRSSIEGQTPEEVNKVNSLLLITFTDILALLIGEPLTTHILLVAWSIDLPLKTDKQFNNE